MTGDDLKSRMVRLGVTMVAALSASAVISVASAGAAQVTVGSASGTPSGTICHATTACTYLTNLTVPFNGTVTSFSVNSASAGGTVRLVAVQVNAYHGLAAVAKSAPQTLTVGLNTFHVSFPVGAGNQLGLDNDSGAVMFDTSNPTAGASFMCWQPSLQQGYIFGFTNPCGSGPGRLLLSATVQSNGTTPGSLAPSITNISQSHRRWRAGGAVARFASAARPPVGTTFRFSLNQAATVRFGFAQLLPGRRVNGKCVAQTTANRNRRACTRSVGRGAISKSATAGAHKLFFQGRLTPTRNLKPGTYRLTITAINSVGLSASRTLRTFTIIPG
jgi:hypothetical protein